MKNAETSFEDVSAEWRQHEDTVRGALRYQLSQENIELYLSNNPLWVLDLGAGTGPDTAWLAKKGHRVVAVEPSASNVRLARERFDSELTESERSRVQLINGYVSDLEASEHNESYDWIISHCVAMYQKDPASYWRSAWKKLRPGGYFSAMESGYAATMNDLILGGAQSAEALERFISKRLYVNNMGQEARAFKFSEIENIFRKLGGQVILRAGIRFEDDDKLAMDLKDFDSQKYQDILSEERVLGHDLEIMKRAQLLQSILQKTL